MFNKKGVSQVVGVAVLLAVTVAIVGIVWGILNTFVLDRLDSAESCHGIFEKVNLNNDYTCYNSSSDTTLVSVNVEDIEITSILIALSYGDHNEIFELDNNSKVIPNMVYYNSALTEVSMPPKEGGRTYLINLPNRPESIQVSPKIKTTQCEVTDKIDSIPNCL